MGRPLRFTPADVPQHIWCRGNQKQEVFADDYDRQRYQRLLVQHAGECAVRILGYCQMTNHIHLVLQPTTDEGLSCMMERLNSEHARAVQFRSERSGHLWQRRFQAAAMDQSYMWKALRYVELNPVRAGMVPCAADWPWSSAAAHLGQAPWPEWLDRQIWRNGWNCAEWSDFLGQPASKDEMDGIRRATRFDRAFAPIGVMHDWETQYGIHLIPTKRGRTPSPTSRRAAARALAVPTSISVGQI